MNNNPNNDLNNQPINNSETNNANLNVQDNNYINPVQQPAQIPPQPLNDNQMAQQSIDNSQVTLNNQTVSPVQQQAQPTATPDNQQIVSQQAPVQSENFQQQNLNNNQMNLNNQQTIPNNMSSVQNMNMDTSNFGPQPNETNNNKSNKNKIIVISLCAILLIVVIGGVSFFLINKDKNNNSNNVNEYEENNEINTSKDDDDEPEVGNTSNSNTINYNGFKFTKVSEYEYEEESGALIVHDNNTAIFINVTKVSFESVKMNYTQLSSILSQQGFTTGIIKVETYNGVEVITCEISDNENNYIYYVISSPDEEFIYEGLVYNRSSFINYNDINEMIEITNNSSYVGDYNDFATEFGIDLNTDSFKF